MTPENEAPGAETEESPFVTIWTKPRATIRRIVATDPTRHVNLLFFCAGFAGGLGNATEPARRIMGSFVLAAPLVVGLMTVPLSHLSALFTRWVGSLLGGTGSVAAVTAALAWSTIPASVGSAGLWLVQLFVFGADSLFAENAAATAAAPPLVATSLVLAAMLFASWSTVLWLVTFAEVNGFSVGKAIATYVIAFAMIGAAVVVPLVVLVIAFWR